MTNEAKADIASDLRELKNDMLCWFFATAGFTVAFWGNTVIPVTNVLVVSGILNGLFVFCVSLKILSIKHTLENSR